MSWTSWSPPAMTPSHYQIFRQLLRGLRFVPRVLIADKLASYGVAHRRLIPSCGTGVAAILRATEF